MLYSVSTYYSFEGKEYAAASVEEADSVEVAKQLAIARVLSTRGKSSNFQLHLVAISDEFLDEYYEDRHDFVTLTKADCEYLRNTCSYHTTWETYPTQIPSFMG